MSIAKLVGIEQEYAINVQGGGSFSAFEVSCLLVNTYARKIGLRQPGIRMLWDYAHETPYEDFRGRLFRKSANQQVIGDEDNRLINAALPNGARFYTDHAHPEYSTAECRSARQAMACDKAGEFILRNAVAAVFALNPEITVSLYKNNTDHKGHSYGCHENYLMDAAAHQYWLVDHLDAAARVLIPFLVTRQVFAGAGKVGGEAPHSQAACYQISQRADFIENIFGLETVYARPIINTRQEHHADARRFRRLHLILGDANMCETAQFLKLGSTQIVLQMMEDDFFDEDLTLKDPLKAIRQLSMAPLAPLELKDGRRLTAMQIQRRFQEKASAFVPSEMAAKVPEQETICALWSEVIDGLEQLRLSPRFDMEDDPGHLHRKLDWVLKLWLLNRYRDKRGGNWDHPLLRVLDLTYHHIDPGKSLFYRLQNDGIAARLIDDDEIGHYVQNPPEDTRAYFRSRCIEKYAAEILLVNWEVVAFNHGRVNRMVPLLNPLKGTRTQFADLFDEARDSVELIARLESRMQDG
jgi:proteasome accessory factor A